MKKGININIQKKDLWLISAIFVFLVGGGFVVAYNAGFSGGIPDIMGHSPDELDGVCKTDGSDCPLSLSSGEVRIWQNMGPKHSADSQDHSTSCNAGYLMSGLRVYITGYIDGFMTAHCTESSLSLSGSTIKTGPSTGADNQFHNVNCDNNQIIKSLTIYAGSYFDGNIRLDCGDLVGANLDDSNIVWADYFYGGVNNNQYPTQLNGFDNRFQAVDCPVGYVATGIRAWAASYLENFDILCKKII